MSLYCIQSISTELGRPNALSQFLYKTTEERSKLAPYVYSWLSSSAGTDILIAVCAVVYFQKVKTELFETKHLLRRLTVAAINTGSITAAVAISILILYRVDHTANYTIAFAVCLGRLYTLTLMFNLLARKNLNRTRKGSGTVISSSQPKPSIVRLCRQDSSAHGIREFFWLSEG